MAALILAIVGAVLTIVILAYGIYVTFYPLHKTVQGGNEAMKGQAEEAQEARVRVETMPEPTVTNYA